MVRAVVIRRQQSTGKELGTLGTCTGMHVNRAGSDGGGRWGWGGSEKEHALGDAEPGCRVKDVGKVKDCASRIRQCGGL